MGKTFKDRRDGGYNPSNSVRKRDKAWRKNRGEKRVVQLPKETDEDFRKDKSPRYEF